MIRVKITLSYDGTNYHGWQIQPNACTVQGELQKALSQLFSTDITVFGCSRTDAGVHAKKFVCQALCGFFACNNLVKNRQQTAMVNIGMGHKHSLFHCIKIRKNLYSNLVHFVVQFYPSLTLFDTIIPTLFQLTQLFVMNATLQLVIYSKQNKRLSMLGIIGVHKLCFSKFLY